MVLNTQRERVYSERRRALLASDLSQQLVEYAERTVDDILEVIGYHQWSLQLPISQDISLFESLYHCLSHPSVYCPLFEVASE